MVVGQGPIPRLLLAGLLLVVSGAAGGAVGFNVVVSCKLCPTQISGFVGVIVTVCAGATLIVVVLKVVQP